MASSANTVAYISEQIQKAGKIRAQKMFGEYGVYCDEFFVGVVCNDTLFIKPTQEGLNFCGDIELAPPYNGAKPSIKISESCLEDADWLCNLVQITRDNLPVKRPKKK